MYVSDLSNSIYTIYTFVNFFTKRLTLLSFSIGLILLSACGGPPQQADENSEGPAVLAATPDSILVFGEVLTGFSYQTTITIYNSSLTIAATNVNLGTNLVAPFSFLGGTYPGTGGTCGAEIAAGGTCTVAVEITPSSVGALASSFTLNYFDGLADQSSVFTFSASARDPIPATLTYTPAGNHDFGILAIGGFSDVSYTISNSGELAASAVNFSGLASPFSIQSNTCGASLAPLASCSISVRFSPGSQAAFNDILSLSYNDGTGPQSINKQFDGEGRVAGFLAIDEGFNFDFGIINNTFVASQTLTVRNTGGGNATSVSFTGISAPFSIFSNSCPATIGPGGSCTIVVRFSPTATSGFASAPTLNYFDGFNNQAPAVNFAGEGFASTLTLSLISPASSPSNSDTPTIRVTNTTNNLRVRLYRNAACSIQVGNAVATGTSIDFSPTIPEASHEFHARAEDADGNLSACSASAVAYEYDNTAPNSPGAPSLGAAFTTFATSSPTFNWTHSGSGDVVDYEVGISANPAGGNDIAGWTSKGYVTFGNHAGLSLTECNYYYASVRAIDDVGLASNHSVSATSFRYDSNPPTAPTNLAESDDASDTNSATIDWTAATDACGIDYYESAISEDTNLNGFLDGSEIGNIKPFTNIGNVTSHRFNGLPTLNTGINHYTSLRAVDTTGRISGTVVSDPWIIYNPAIELPDMIVWLDGNDPATILDAEGDDANSGGAFSGIISTWLDKSGSTNTHHFTVTGGSTAPTYDPLNFSAIFDGASTGMTTPDHSEINNANVDQRNLTVAFKTSADVNTRQVLYEEGGNIRGMTIYLYNGNVYCGFFNTPDDGDGSQPFVSVNTPVSANSVYYVTWVFDYTNYAGPAGPDGSLNCYMNGASIGATTTTSRLFAHSGNVGLGHIDNTICFEDASCPSSGAKFLGEIYEVMLFNNAPDSSAVDNVHTYLSNKWD